VQLILNKKIISVKPADAGQTVSWVKKQINNVALNINLNSRYNDKSRLLSNRASNIKYRTTTTAWFHS